MKYRFWFSQPGPSFCPMTQRILPGSLSTPLSTPSLLRASPLVRPLPSLSRPRLTVCAHIGILTLQPTSQPKTKAAGLGRHQIAMITGFLALGLGSSAMWYNKESHGAPHITTWHGVRPSLLDALPLSSFRRMLTAPLF